MHTRIRYELVMDTLEARRLRQRLRERGHIQPLVSVIQPDDHLFREIILQEFGILLEAHFIYYVTVLICFGVPDD